MPKRLHRIYHLCRLACLCGALFTSARVRAQALPEDPPHYLVLASLGVPLRLTVDDVLAQRRLAPAFGNVLLGYTLSGGPLRHGFGLGVSWNLTHDGGYTEALYAGDQIMLMPAYLAYAALSPDVVGIGHVGVPILVRGGKSAGLEIGAALAYRMFAGAGLFAGLSLDAYGARVFNLLASFELGVLIDYEVLP